MLDPDSSEKVVVVLRLSDLHVICNTFRRDVMLEQFLGRSNHRCIDASVDRSIDRSIVHRCIDAFWWLNDADVFFLQHYLMDVILYPFFGPSVLRSTGASIERWIDRSCIEGSIDGGPRFW